MRFFTHHVREHDAQQWQQDQFLHSSRHLHSLVETDSSFPFSLLEKVFLYSQSLSLRNLF